MVSSQRFLVLMSEARAAGCQQEVEQGQIICCHLPYDTIVTDIFAARYCLSQVDNVSAICEAFRLKMPWIVEWT